MRQFLWNASYIVAKNYLNIFRQQLADNEWQEAQIFFLNRLHNQKNISTVIMHIELGLNRRVVDQVEFECYGSPSIATLQ
jgi:hypothetical protein